MSYTPPSIGAAGLTVPPLTDIQAQMLAQFRSIYGQNVYLGNDSADRQFSDVISLMIADTMKVAQLVYNNRSPATAVGSGLDAIVKMNGLLRKSASFSTCQVTLTGTPGAQINNGIIQDSVFGKKWDLPPALVIGGGGTVTTSAICEEIGAFSVAPGQLTIIVTPQLGWTSVTNATDSVPGQAVEVDSTLRARQAVSTEGPANTLLAATIAAVLAVPGVVRINPGNNAVPSPIENPASAVDSYGNPPHSISMVVEGGLDLAVATAIYSRRGIGPFTNPNPGGAPRSGSTTVAVTDPQSGITINIGFARPTKVPIFVTVNAHLLVGGTSDLITAMQQAIVNYLNVLQIGELVSYGAIWAAAMSVNPDITRPVVTIVDLKTAKTVTPTGTVDLTLFFWEVSQGITANVIVNPV